MTQDPNLRTRQMSRRAVLGGSAVAGGALLAAPALAKADAVLEWKMVTSWPKNLPGPGVTAERLAQRITAATSGAPIRLAIDAVGGPQIVRFADALADEATVINYGRLSGENPQLSPHQCVFKRVTLTGFWLVPWLQRMPRAEIAMLYSGLAKHVADGSLHVPVQATFPIEEIKQALAVANGYHRAGKVLVTPNGPVG